MRHLTIVGLAALTAANLATAPVGAQTAPAPDRIGAWALAKSPAGWNFAWLSAEGTASGDICRAWVAGGTPKNIATGTGRIGCFLVGCFRASPNAPVQYELTLLMSGVAARQGQSQLQRGDARGMNIELRTDQGAVFIRTIADSIGGIVVTDPQPGALQFIELIAQPDRPRLDRLMSVGEARVGPIKGRYAAHIGRFEARGLDIGEYVFKLGGAGAVLVQLEQRCK